MSSTLPVDTPPVDLTDPELFRDGFPHEVFSRLRRESPVFWYPASERTPGSDPGFWVITRYADVQAVNRDADRFSAYDGPQLADGEGMKGNMLVSMDGADHLRQRRLISAGFTPRMIATLEERARAWAVAVVDHALEQGTCDFVTEVAYQLPMHMIADIVGIPVEDRDWLFTLVNDFLVAGGPDSTTTREEQLALQIRMFQYATALGEKKRAEPADDVWTVLSTVEVEGPDGEATMLGQLELDLFFLVLTVAGSETTRNALAAGLVALVEHPDQLELLRRDPGVMKTAVEEIIRWTSPVSYFARRATVDVEIGGRMIRAGDRVSIWYPSANRDEAAFDDPFRFDITRDPNHHVSFGGGGPHFCLGAHLARREISVLFEELLRRVDHIELAGPPGYTVLGLNNPVLLALSELPVRLS